MHFFRAEFDEAIFSGMLSGETNTLPLNTFQQEYLGFIVVKPLPSTVIGRTCLQTYPDAGRRHYPITRIYDANLFGIGLNVETLAYQEQDSVAAACATSALWSAFHGTGKQFQHPMPSPVEITKAATSHIPHDTRTFPNSSGLSSLQMADAIRAVGLEPCLVSASDEWVLRSTVYAYLRGQIPVILVIGLYHSINTPDTSAETPPCFGFHAVTTAGYSLNEQQPLFYPQTNFALRAFRMDKIYAHDDQVGPFARIELIGGSHFRTYWKEDAVQGKTYADALFMLIPLYHKIRIPFQMIFDAVITFHSLIDRLQQGGVFTLPGTLEWDVYLTSVNTLKEELHTTPSLAGAYRLNVVTQEMPRFIWRATALVNDMPMLDLLFDATDIEQGASFVGVIKHNPALGQIMTDVAQILVQQHQTFGRSDRHILEWLANPVF